MFPEDGDKPLPRGVAGRRRGEHPRSDGRDGGGLAVVAVGGQRGTLYDSFELNAMVARLNRLLNANGDGAGGSGGGSLDGSASSWYITFSMSRTRRSARWCGRARWRGCRSATGRWRSGRARGANCSKWRSPR